MPISIQKPDFGLLERLQTTETQKKETLVLMVSWDETERYREVGPLIVNRKISVVSIVGEGGLLSS